MPKVRLTAAAVERLKPPATGQIDYFDTAYPALALRVTAKGVRSWVYFGRVRGRIKRATLGRYPDLSLAQARRKAGETADAMRQGVDPASAKRAAALAVPDSFAAVAAEWLKRDQAKNRSVDNVRSIMARYALPAWGDRVITTIGRRDVIELIDSVADRGFPIMAHRVHSHLHRLFRWSVGRGILEINPMADLPRQGAAVRRDRVLDDAELALVWQAAVKTSWPFGPVVRLLILTAARRDEIGGLRWSEIEVDKINLKGERTKNAEPRTIALSPAAADLVRALPRVRSSALVFTTTGATSVSGWSRAKTLLDHAIEGINGGAPLAPWRLHDLRRSAATGMQKLGVSLQAIEAVLGHISGSRSGVVGIYQRHSFEPEARAALEAWARHIDAIVNGEPGNVVSMMRA
jgi:integrase